MEKVTMAIITDDIMATTEAMERRRISINQYKKWYLAVVSIVLLTIGIVISAQRSYAYTDEEKAQAKAWLSAHGYSPDAGGAAAAYQDYLDGKFDDELGITRDDSTEAGTQSAYDEESDKDEDSNVLNDNSYDSSAEVSTEGESVWGIMGSSSEENTGDDNTVDKAITEESSTQMEYKEPKDAEDSFAQPEKVLEDEKNSAITIYRSDNMDKYKEAFFVIVISLLICMLGIGMGILMKKD